VLFLKKNCKIAEHWRFSSLKRSHPCWPSAQSLSGRVAESDQNTLKLYIPNFYACRSALKGLMWR